jgi:uncharacterized membrane protein
MLLLLVASITACADPVRPPEATGVALRDSTPNVTTMFAVTVKDLGTLPGGWQSRTIGNNDKGEVVGWSTGADERPEATVRTAANRFHVLPALPGGSDRRANDINGNNQVVGWSTNSGGQIHAVLWTLRWIRVLAPDIATPNVEVTRV